MQIKKYLILVLVLGLLFPRLTSAQTNIKRDYLNQRDKYYRVYNNFLSSRRNYWQQGTIQSKEKFRQDSKDFLLSRDDLLLTYFDYLLSKSTFVDSQYREQLSNWQGWIIEHQKKIGKAYSLEDLIELSQEFDEIYPEIERSTYTFLFNRVVGRQSRIKTEMKTLSQKLVLETTNDDWQIEVNNQLNQIESYQQEGQDSLERIRIVRPGDMRKKWNAIAEDLSSAKNSLFQALNYLDEVISNNEKN